VTLDISNQKMEKVLYRPQEKIMAIFSIRALIILIKFQ
jgi:hypothetical protein